MQPVLPNFLIVGAAKSGTTSLYHYLSEHPQIFMSALKEPKFLSSDYLKFPLKGNNDQISERAIVKDFDEYQKLFIEAKSYRAIGEASPDTLYFHKGTVPTIKKVLDEPRIIIILRNPVDRAFSNYTYQVISNRENLTFEQALDQEQHRIANNWSFIWGYQDLGFYYEQVKTFLDNFSQVKVCLYENLESDPLKLVTDIYHFLGVDISYVPDLEKIHNRSGIPKSRMLHNLLTQSSPIKKWIKPMMLSLVSRETIQRFRTKVFDQNLAKLDLSSGTRKKLIQLYREDVLKLQELIKRDLSHWDR